jgi:hypothetical protein
VEDAAAAANVTGNALLLRGVFGLRPLPARNYRPDAGHNAGASDPLLDERRRHVSDDL